MKNESKVFRTFTAYYILREDLEYSSDRLFRLALSINPGIEDSEVDIRMMFNLPLMYDLEESLLEGGILYSWLEEQPNSIVGIIIHSTEEDIIGMYLDDCMTMENYSKFRLRQFNELTFSKDKKHPEYLSN